MLLGYSSPSIKCICGCSKFMLIAIPVMGCATVENIVLSKAMEWTLAEPCYKHAGRARGTRMNAQAVWSPRAGSNLALVQYGLVMEGGRMEDLLLELNCAWTPLLMLLLLHLNQKICRILERSKVILTSFFSLGRLLYFYLKSLLWISLYVLFLSHCTFFVEKENSITMFVLCLLPSSLPSSFILCLRQTERQIDRHKHGCSIQVILFLH